MKSLASIDLNLLVALDALLQEANVTRAARRMHLSQPAMSRALGRLRELFDDELLVRSPDGMRLTARGRELAPRVRDLLGELHHVIFDEDGFDPASADRRFVLATSDYGGLVVLPPFVRIIGQEAPSVRLSVRSLPRSLPTQALADGEVDLLVGTFSDPVEGLPHEVLFEDGFVCLTPPSLGELSLDRYVEMGHVLVSSPREGRGVVDHALERIGRSRHVAIRVPHFAVAPRLIANAELVVTLPRRLVEALGPIPGVRVCDPPLDLPTFPVVMIWHERTEGHPAFDWLRDRLRFAAGASITDDGTRLVEG